MADNLSTFTTAEKQAYLAALQRARLELMSGKRVVRAGYTQAGINRNVEYAVADLGAIQALIQEVSVSLGLSSGRRAIGVRFGGRSSSRFGC